MSNKTDAPLSKRKKSPGAGKEIGRFKTVMGKGKRACEWEVITKVADDPVPMEQVAEEFARIVAPLIRERLLQESKAEESTKHRETSHQE